MGEATMSKERYEKSKDTSLLTHHPSSSPPPPLPHLTFISSINNNIIHKRLGDLSSFGYNPPFNKRLPLINRITNAKSNNSKKMKRQRQNKTPTELYEAECTSRYAKLHHTCSKLLHREGKVVKSFECQKIVRAIKAANEAEKAKKKVASLEMKLERTKKFDLDVLVSVGLKRLGVLSLDPKLSNFADGESGSDDAAQPKGGQQTQEDPSYTLLIESMLRHKRLSAIMDQINEKVSEYQQWATNRRQVLMGDSSDSKNKKKRKQNQSSSRGDPNETLIVAGNTRRKIDLGGHEGTSGLFIGSLSGQKPEGYSDDEEGYNSYDDDAMFQKKKNRPGQRARKAKAMAVEARKAGRTWDSSLNWREKKEDSDQIDKGRKSKQRGNEGDFSSKKARSENDGSTKPISQDIATMGKSWKEDGKAHPSWAAAAAQKSQGIVEFKGTKITF
jgi:hypothetical protein